tara:strand:+ start:561 stop:686 length:126 start_codon:yes stop_codon:yes gene_type:complete
MKKMFQNSQYKQAKGGDNSKVKNKNPNDENLGEYIDYEEID